MYKSTSEVREGDLVNVILEPTVYILFSLTSFSEIKLAREIGLDTLQIMLCCPMLKPETNCGP